MANFFVGDGNLADAPRLNTIEVDGEERTVANMRLFINRHRKNVDGKYEDRGGFWLNASCWGQKAREAGRLLQKGALIKVEGELEQQKWIDDEGNERTGLTLNIRDWSLLPFRLEEVSYKNRSDAAGSEGRG